MAGMWPCPMMTRMNDVKVPCCCYVRLTSRRQSFILSSCTSRKSRKHHSTHGPWPGRGAFFSISAKNTTFLNPNAAMGVAGDALPYGNRLHHPRPTRSPRHLRLPPVMTRHRRRQSQDVVPLLLVLALLLPGHVPLGARAADCSGRTLLDEATDGAVGIFGDGPGPYAARTECEWLIRGEWSECRLLQWGGSGWPCGRRCYAAAGGDRARTAGGPGRGVSAPPARIGMQPNSRPGDRQAAGCAAGGPAAVTLLLLAQPRSGGDGRPGCLRGRASRTAAARQQAMLAVSPARSVAA